MAADNCGASPPPLQSGGRLVEENLSNADLSFSHSKFPLEISWYHGLRVAREQVEAVGWGPSSSVLGYRTRRKALHAVYRTISIERNYRVFQDKMENNLFLLGSVLFPFLYHLILRRWSNRCNYVSHLFIYFFLYWKRKKQKVKTATMKLRLVTVSLGSLLLWNIRTSEPSHGYYIVK